MKDQPSLVPEMVSSLDITQTYPHEGCSGVMEWDSDFKLGGRQFIVHKCSKCRHSETRSYDLQSVVREWKFEAF